VSKPASGLDIEIEDTNQDTVCREGLFRACEFVNNLSSGMISDGQGKPFDEQAGFTRFEDCVFWSGSGTSADGHAVFPRNKALIFDRCRIYGHCSNAWGDAREELATRFLGCDFEDRPHPEFGEPAVVPADHLIDVWGDNILFAGCRVIANRRRAFFVYGLADNGTYSLRTTIRNTTVTHKAIDVDYQSIFWARTVLEDVRFLEEFPSSYPDNHWFISNGDCDPAHDVRVRNVRVAGPKVGWGRASRLTGLIPDNPCIP